MTKTELESKHLAELHSLAADAGVPGYRMLRREELIAKLLEGERRAEPGRRAPRDRGRRARGEPGREAEPAKPAEAAAGPARPKRRRRRRRWGRRKRVRVHDLLLSATPGGRAIVYPSPEELADWKRDAPKAEIVAAGQARHADDAIAQAARRAEGGEAVVVLIDSLSRFAEAFGAAEDARELFEAGSDVARTGSGSLTVVGAVERQ
jgi:hypothetical protein